MVNCYDLVMIVKFVSSLLLISLSTSSCGLHPSYGNELAQLDRYISLVDTQGTLNVSELYEAYRSCEQSISPEKGFRFYTCRGDIRKQQTVKRSHLYKPERRTANSKKYLTDCKYRVVNTSDSSSSFQITQSDCKSGFSLSQGGSTFEISATSTEYLALCRVIDEFNDIYNVYCDFPPKGITEKECPFVTIFVHFEHFGAFSDLGDDNFAPMNRTIYSGQICFPTNTLQLSSVKLAGESTSEYFWIRNNSTFIPHNNTMGTTIETIPSIISTSTDVLSEQYLVSGDYSWRGKKEKYLTVSAMQQCLKFQDISFIGESHMRYQFDLVITRYIDKSEVERKHGDMNNSGILFQDCTFSNRLISTLEKVTCDFPNKITTYVLQTGSWDLQFFPPRGFVKSPYQMNAVLDTIEKMWERLKKGKCEDKIRIVWMSIMPHPWCQGNDAHCLRLANYYRNNGAINAANEYIEKKILSINMKHLIYVDTGAILLPRFHLREFLCVDHFICNVPPSGLFTTPGGTALMNHILLHTCRDFIPNEDEKYSTNENGCQNNTIDNTNTDFNNYNNSIQILNSVDSNRIPPKHQNFTYFTNRLNVRSLSGELYIVQEGCRRKIPDTVTAEFMGMNLKIFQNISEFALADIPTCYHAQYPSRRTYTLLQTFNSRTVYFMDGGQRRPVEGVATMVSLGLDFDQIQHITDDDMNLITEGKILKTKTDCNTCN